MPYNTYINPTIRRKLFKEISRMEARTNTKYKQDAWRGVVAVLNQHNNLMDVNNSYAKEGAKISEYYREHGGDKAEIREYESIAAMRDDYEPDHNTPAYKVDFDESQLADPLENFIDRHFKVITAVILFTFVGLSWFIGA